MLLMKWRVMMRWRSTSKRETGLSICASCMRTFSVLMPSVDALISPCPLSWWGAMRLWPVPATVRLITCDSCAITTFPVLPMIWKRRAFYLFLLMAHWIRILLMLCGGWVTTLMWGISRKTQSKLPACWISGRKKPASMQTVLARRLANCPAILPASLTISIKFEPQALRPGVMPSFRSLIFGLSKVWTLMVKTV